MHRFNNLVTARRRFLLGGAGAIGLLALPGCATLAEWSYVDAIRRLLERATSNAFARLTAADGFWDSAVARVGLPDLFGGRGSALQGALASVVFKKKLQKQLNRVAEDGARRAAPIVADAVRAIGTENAVAILRGKSDAATSLLRGEMGTALVGAMVPALGDAMRIAQDPILSRALSALAGVDISDAAEALAVDVDDAIWSEIGLAEAEIRTNPEATGDAVLIAALKGL
ncbi:MAG: DUF4197 domain-containing protein [Sphingomonadaceae bacterium]|nr:DUF4197 domain-containing protein [Sphingomonadaceae bacterium]